MLHHERISALGLSPMSLARRGPNVEDTIPSARLGRASGQRIPETPGEVSETIQYMGAAGGSDGHFAQVPAIGRNEIFH